ncbi:hypothetical protein BH11PSE7_BH11PSE7_33200 [soil metagenome]
MTTLYRPDPLTLCSGDLVWPKADDQIVCYLTGDDYDMLWRQQRDAYVAMVSANPAATQQERELAMLVDGWSYAEFVTFPPSSFAAAMDRPWVGHVGVVEVRDGVPWVIDATPHRALGGVPGASGVADQTWNDWVGDDGHLKSHVWHGRLRDLTPEQAATIPVAARTQIGKPYQFFNFNLDDIAGFYCSKLVWYAVWSALKLSLDAGPPNRSFWVSPLQLMRSAGVHLLYVPPGREYGLERALAHMTLRDRAV